MAIACSVPAAARPILRAAGFVFLLGLLLLPLSVTGALAQKLPAPVYATRAALPPDADLVLAALVQRLKGEEAGRGVRFDSGAQIDVREADFAYAGFRFTDAALFEYNQASETERVVSGTVSLEDNLGRRAQVLVSAAYRLDGATPIVLEAEAAPLFSAGPNSAIFVVAADVVEGAGANMPTTYQGLMGFAIKNAVSWAHPERVIAGPRRYVIFVFARDRISPSASAEVLISDSAEGKGGAGGGTRYLDDHGWRAAILPGQFALDNAKLFVKVVFKPGREAGFFERGKKVVGLYNLNFLAEQAVKDGYTFVARTGPEGGDTAGAADNAGVVAALPPNRYDGAWRLRLNINRGEPNCTGVINFKTRWQDGKISGTGMHPYVGRVTIEGEIDGAGRLKVQAAGGLVLRVAGVADSDSTAKGTVDIIIAGFNCAGKWTAKKTGD